MFEAYELGRTISRNAYDRKLPGVHARLLKAQQALRDAPFPVMIIIGGTGGAGKGELVHRLNEWLDPRGVATQALSHPSDEERERPEFWRFWRILPGRGRIGILFGSWYVDPIVRRAYGKSKASQLDAELNCIAGFEKMLAEDGALFVKLWLHLPKKQQKKRLKELDKQGRLAPEDWKHHKHYDDFAVVCERVVRRTDAAHAKWHVIEAADGRYRELTALTLLVEALEAHLKPARARAALKTDSAESPVRIMPSRGEGSQSILASVDLTQCLTKNEYEKSLDDYRNRLSRLAWTLHRKQRSMVLVFEGWDAAGKGSAIRRVTQAMDPRLYRTVGIAAPTDEERAQHYLWRFWRHLPRAGLTTIFDRSWYGRVLVERVEGFATPAEWSRAYGEINAFEEQLADHGIVLCKFWLHISQEEQLRRFRERQKVAQKRYKITAEDWRNRKQWPAYQEAVTEMVARCSTEFAPWKLVAGNDKKFARIQILRTIVERIETALD